VKVPFLIPEWPAPATVGALATTRQGGTSRAPYDDGTGAGGLNLALHVGDDPLSVQANRDVLRTHLPAEPMWLNQVHGRAVLVATGSGHVTDADACIATQAGMVCAVQTADCLPVLFCDRAGKVVGAAHAGWRGLAGGVLENTVGRMRASGATDILAWMGPAIGPRRFEVGTEVKEAFVARSTRAESAFVPTSPGKYRADLYALARLLLAGAGVTQVYGGDWCTFEDRLRFFSYRRDGVTGRMASLIWIK
jgi:polyphenol oxidase